MTALVRYEAAKAALAECRTVDEVKTIRDQWEAIATYRRISGDFGLEADAAEIRERAERRLGILLKAAKDKGQISRGQPKKNSAETEEFSRVKLADAGIDHKLSARAQKKAGIGERAYEAMLKRMREQIIGGKRMPDVLRVDMGAVNGSRSIMGSREEPDDSLDYFPTPPWATRALMARVLPLMGARDLGRVWEPACGEGHIAEVLREYGEHVEATDVFDYGYGDGIFDFLAGEPEANLCDWTITNPPFGDAAIEFVKRGLVVSRKGVAMFFRSQWAVEGVERYEQIFKVHPPTLCAFFVERVNLCKGRWDPDGSTATAYCWLIWKHGEEPRAPLWIPPGCRSALTLVDDRERFTAHPVIKKPRDDAGKEIAHDASGEIIEARSEASDESQSHNDSSATDDRETGTLPSRESESLEIPKFLRRSVNSQAEAG